MRCKYQKNNKKCKANAISNSQFCFWHDPNVKEEDRQLARSRGGKTNKIEVAEPLPKIEVKTPSDVVALLNDTIQRVRSGEIDIKIANCIGYLSGHLIKALEVSELESRLEYVEREIREKILKVK